MTLIRLILFYITSFALSVWPAASVVEGVVGQPVSFFPHQAVSQEDKTISNLLYRSIFKYDAEGVLVNDLAKDWSVSDDGLVYTIEIKEGQLWATGEEITSDDLIYTAFKLPELLGVGTDKIDEYTVRYILPNKFASFPSVLTAGVMPENSEEMQNPLMPVSSGNFRVVSIKRDGPAISKIILYNTSPDSKIKKLVFRYYSREADLLTAAMLGEIDTFLSTDNVELERFDSNEVVLNSIYYALFLNLRNEELDDIEFREKLHRTLNVEELTSSLGILAQGPFSRTPYYNESVDFQIFDESLVPEYLDKDFEITVPNSRRQRNLAEKIKSSWEERLGLTISINAVDPDEIMELVVPTREFDILLYGQQIGRDPDRYVYWHSSQIDHPGLNIPGLDNVRIDLSLEEGRAALDVEERVLHYNDFQITLLEQKSTIFLYHPYVNYYISQNISGIYTGDLFNIWNRFDNFNDWERVFIN